MSLVIGVAVLALILLRQVRSRPLAGNAVLVIVLGVLGLAETGGFLFGIQQFVSFLKGHSHHLALAVPDGGTMVAAALGSLVLATVTGALQASRAPQNTLPVHFLALVTDGHEHPVRGICVGLRR
jgi:hypothetical protein